MLKILKCSITTPDPPHWYYPRCKTRELFCPREGWWPAPGSSRSPPCPSDLFHSCPGEETCQRTHKKFACNGKPGVQCLNLFSAEARFLLQKPCQSKPGVVTWIAFSSSAWRWREDLVGFCFQRAKLRNYNGIEGDTSSCPLVRTASKMSPLLSAAPFSGERRNAALANFVNAKPHL